MIGGPLLVLTILVGAFFTVRAMLRSDHPVSVAIAGAVLTLFGLRLVAGALIGLVMLVLLVAFAVHGMR